MQVSACARTLLVSGSLLLPIEALSGCSVLTTEHIVYDEHGIRIGLQADPSVSRSPHPVANSHPANLSAEEILALLQTLQVSGWSGTLVGLFATPRAVPLFTAKQLSMIAPFLARAFREAKPTERVVFSLPKPDVSYSEDRTEGSLFLRGRYLHVVVTDHSSFIQADTGGGEVKDIRDTKGMKLWVAGLAQAATVPDAEEPRWAPFEAVHISLNAKETLAQQTQSPPARPATPPAAPSQSIPHTERATVTQADLQLQLRDLTTSNMELRGRLEEQHKRMEQLHEELDQLRLELDKAKPRKLPSRKIPAQ
jgi:hypothetical protein